PRPLPERLGRMGVALTVLGVLIQACSILLRGLATHRWPLGNMYEYISFFGLVAICTWLVMMRRFPVRRISGFVLLPVVVLLFLAGTVLYTVAAPVMPALQSYWLYIHVTVISSSSAILLVPGVASVMYLLRAVNEANPARLATLAPRLPSKDALDRVAYRTTIFAFPLYTFGVICGAIWAESAWGRFWGWDPKETTAFIVWVCYAAYLHSRATAGWRGNRAAVINAIGFAAALFNLFFINLVTTGLHSYAGLN
ncbi:MAG: c-type cytochrome biogenesis protein CcsB, partial [Sciscionella sp.]